MLRGVTSTAPGPTISTPRGPFRGPGYSGPDSAFRKGFPVKVRASVRRMCKDCQIVRRKGKVRVICKAGPKHKQVQG